MKNFIFTATAKSKTIFVEYVIEIATISPLQCMVFEDKAYFSRLCNIGCKNYSRKWSCPPHAPAFSTIAIGWSRLYVLYMRMPLDAFSGIKNKYLKIKAANSMLKSRADKYIRSLAEKYGSYISTGSCRLCKPCNLQKEMPCAHPLTMAYSFEALGINVEELINRYFNHPLLWYKNGELPEYTSVVCGLLTNEELSFETLQQQYLRIVQES